MRKPFFQPEEEQGLVDRLLAGDVAARNEIIQRVQPLLIREAMNSRFACKRDIDDLVQIFSLHLITELPKFKPEEGKKLVYFVKNICRYRVKYIIRENKYGRNNLNKNYLYKDEAATECRPPEADDIEVLREAISRLTGNIREAVEAKINLETFELIKRFDFNVHDPKKYDSQSSFAHRFKLGMNKLKLIILEIDPDFGWDIVLDPYFVARFTLPEKKRASKFMPEALTLKRKQVKKKDVQCSMST